jgi:Winged helix DNA-binding domain
VTSLTARQLNRATLARQMLLRREDTDVTEAVRRMVALQAQEAASPYLALWNRLAPFDPADLDAAFARHAVVKATLMRLTLHAVHADDYPAFHQAMVPILRAARLGDRRFTGTGLTVAEADALVPHLLEYLTQHRGNAEVEALLAERLGASKPRMWWAMRAFAPLVHAPAAGGPWSFGPRPRYLASPIPPTEAGAGECLQYLIRRYLEGFGPATAADIGQFTMHRRPSTRTAIDAMQHELDRLEGPDGTELFDVPGAPRPDPGTPAPPRLMAMWDSVLLAYSDRSRVIPPEYRALVVRRNGDVLPTLLVDGYVAGVWRPADAGIEATAFHPLPEQDWAGLAAEAGDLASFLAGRDPAVYRRYHHWWKELPAAQTRVLPG